MLKNDNGPLRWALEMQSNLGPYWICDNLTPALFLTRREAIEYARKEYGYIATRKDLRRPPHNWRMPKPVRVRINLTPVDLKIAI
jgi:hypothetical protein